MYKNPIIVYTVFIFCITGDIGGSMGLFIGASAMSLFELVDLLVDQSFKQALSAGKR